MSRIRNLSIIFLCLFSLSICNAQTQKPRPKLVVTIVVDQFRYDYLTRFRAEYRGGIARMVKNGAVFTDARYPQFPTVTAVGHSTLLTGATPSVSGIVSNEWFDRAVKHGPVTSVSDDATHLLGGVPSAKGASPARLLVSTVGDELKMAGRDSRVIGISLKDRGAILPAGHMADAAYWFDSKSGNFVSSDYYMQDLPTWVKTVNQGQPVSKYKNAEWSSLHAQQGEKPFCSMAAGTDVRPCDGIENTPFGNELVEEFAEKVIVNEHLGEHKSTDVLAVSFSANDYVGHLLGPDSPEVHDLSLRTDLLLGKLIDFISQRVGDGNTLFVFTADHGVAPVPTVNNARRMPGAYLKDSDYASPISARLAEKFGPGDWFIYNAYGFFYLNYDTAARNKAELAEVRRYAAEIARGLPFIARVFTREDLLNGNAAADSVGRSMQLGFYASRSSDLILLPEPYCMFFTAPGTTHATPYGYDTHVPLIFYGAGIKKGLHYQPVAINDVAPTLAAILEVETPSGSSGRILSEVIEQGH
jgi:predicted AlkP superfamily pyrophosphatase or phosphodiesterase